MAPTISTSIRESKTELVASQGRNRKSYRWRKVKNGQTQRLAQLCLLTERRYSNYKQRTFLHEIWWRAVGGRSGNGSLSARRRDFPFMSRAFLSHSWVRMIHDCPTSQKHVRSELRGVGAVGVKRRRSGAQISEFCNKIACM
jgi:hypothetical protein